MSMYNRYIRNRQGEFTRVQEDVPESTPPLCGPPPSPSGAPSGAANSAAFLSAEDTHLIQRILSKFGMSSIDTGDLLLLLILFLLFSESDERDEELLIALGLLLIL